MRTELPFAESPSTQNGCSDLPGPEENCRSDFGAVARALWPEKTAATLAHLAGGASERAARDWLAGRTEPPGLFATLILSRCYPKRV